MIRTHKHQISTEEYVGETDRMTKERVIDHNKRDKNSQILKHSREPVKKVTLTYVTKISKYQVTIIVQVSNGRLMKLYS